MTERLWGGGEQGLRFCPGRLKKGGGAVAVKGRSVAPVAVRGEHISKARILPELQVLAAINRADFWGGIIKKVEEAAAVLRRKR